MALECHRQLALRNARPIVFYCDQTHATGQQAHGNLTGTRIERVVYQFAYHRGWPFDHFAGSDLADQLVGEFADGAARWRGE